MGVGIDQTPRYVASSWRYKWYVLAAALIAAAIGYGVSTLQEPVYLAEGTVLLSDPLSSGGVSDEIGFISDPRRYVPNQVKILESLEVAQRAAESLGSGITPSEVQDATSATPALDLGAITISGTMPTGIEAVATVDAVATAYEEIISEQVQNSAAQTIATLEASKAETEARISELDALIAESPDDSVLEAERTAAISQFVAFDTRIEFLTTNTALYGSGVQLYVPPDTPTNPIQPRPKATAAIAFVLGAVAASGLAWWRAEQHQVSDNRNDPALVLDAPLLATIPNFKSAGADGQMPTISAPKSEVAEAYQFASSSIGFVLENIQGTTVLITSTSPGDGKSVTAINLSIAAAQDGTRTLLIDADERARGLTNLAGLQNELGISDLDGTGDITRSVHRWALDDGTRLDFVPAGTGVAGNTASFFRSDGFRTALDALLEGREMVIVDSPPVMAAAETTDVAAAVDGVVLVVAEGTPLRDLEDARQRLTMSGTPIVGYVFNKATSTSGRGGYGYGYGRKT